MDKVSRFLNPATAAEQPEEQNGIMSEVRKCIDDLELCIMFPVIDFWTVMGYTYKSVWLVYTGIGDARTWRK